MDYYKMKANLLKDTKAHMEAVVIAIDSNIPAPTWRSFVLRMAERYGVSESACKKSLEIIGMTVDEHGCYDRIDAPEENFDERILKTKQHVEEAMQKLKEGFKKDDEKDVV